MSFWLGGTPGAGGALTWTTPLPWVALGVVVGLLAWALAAWTGRGASPRLRAAELVLWALTLGLLVVSLARPRWVEEEGRREAARLVALVDTSASMGVREGGAARGSAVQDILDRLGPDVEVYTFDEELRASTVGEDGGPGTFAGRGTDLGVALQALDERYLGQKLRGVALITDGLDRGALRREWRAGGSMSLPDLPGPLTVYQVGQGTDLHDLAIDDVVTGGFAFLRTPFTLTAKLRGAAHARVPVTLSREGRLVTTREVTLDDKGEAQAEFQVTPTAVGRFSWELSVPVAPDDAVPGNNTFPVVVRVVRDRTRVLQVSGSPSYDQKFLRLFLKEDPSVDLVSFFILRTHEDMGAGWASDELSLIEFPYDRLFSEDLDTFDLVVLQNFNYEPYFAFRQKELLENLAQYVKSGKALVMTGGDRSFDLGAYQNTPLGEVLPLKLGVDGVKSDEATFRPKLTAAGMAHPITRLAGDPDESKATWDRLPEMDGLNLTLGPAEGAAVLLEHPSRSCNGRPCPVLAVREVGEGRTMALTVDASWRWSFTEAAEGRGNQAYLRFWKNAMRWLVGDPADRRVVVTPSRENVLLGDEVRLVVKVRDAGYQPVPNAAVSLSVQGPEGEAARYTLTTDSAGEAATGFRPTSRGAHRVTAKAGGNASDRGETVFAVSARDPELVEIVPDRSFLEALASAAGGRYVPPGEAADPLVDPDAGREVHERKETDLGTSPLLALLIGITASGAWTLRRRAGAR